MLGRILLRTGRAVRSWWRRAFPKKPEHVHSDLRNFEQRLTAYRNASDAARAVLRNRSAAAGSALPGTVLGAGPTAIVALTDLIGTYTIFLMQSGLGCRKRCTGAFGRSSRRRQARGSENIPQRGPRRHGQSVAQRR